MTFSQENADLLQNSPYISKTYSLYISYSYELYQEIESDVQKMSVANPDKMCYRHWISTIDPVKSEEARQHRFLCSGYDKGSDSPTSTYSCLNFVSVADIQRGICAYEHRAKRGFGDTPIKSVEHSCKECNSNHDSGKAPDEEDPDERGCTAYTPMLHVLQGICAWHVRSERLLDLYHGDRSKLKPEELYCLNECSAKRDAPCNGYIDVKHVVHQTCFHKVNLDNKIRLGGKLEGLEIICNGCEGECQTKKCDRGYTSVTEKHHFEAINDIHPLKIKKQQKPAEVVAA